MQGKVQQGVLLEVAIEDAAERARALAATYHNHQHDQQTVNRAEQSRSQRRKVQSRGRRTDLVSSPNEAIHVSVNVFTLWFTARQAPTEDQPPATGGGRAAGSRDLLSKQHKQAGSVRELSREMPSDSQPSGHQPATTQQSMEKSSRSIMRDWARSCWSKQ